MNTRLYTALRRAPITTSYLQRCRIIQPIRSTRFFSTTTFNPNAPPLTTVLEDNEQYIAPNDFYPAKDVTDLLITKDCAEVDYIQNYLYIP
jgi:hypothetical protein